MLVAQILKDKGGEVFSAQPDDSLAQAAASLHDKRVGALVVCDGDSVVGVLSERDIVRAVAKGGAETLADPIRNWMTADVVFAEPNESIALLMARMTDRRVRHLPVMESARLAGVISIGDVVKCQIAEARIEAESLKSYIAGG